MKNEKLSVYYDGKCSLCSAEISHYMKKDKEKNICFVDISDENFAPEEHGLANRDIHVNLHVKFADGQICSGVNAFIDTPESEEITTSIEKALAEK